MKCLLFLSFVLLQLAYPTSSFVACGHKTPNASGNHFRLRSTGNDESDKTSESTEGDANFFERTVRKVSRNKNYKFGDLTKTAATASTRTIEGAVRKVIRDDDYEFGDITKKVFSTGSGTFEGAVKSITGNEEYRFGDLTKKAVGAVKSSTDKIMTYSEKTLNLLRDANIHELVELMNFFWTNNMTPDEQKEAFAVIVYLGAIIVLAYNFIANLMTGVVFAAAWYKVAVATGSSPMNAWDTFLNTKATIEIIFGGPFLPLRVAATIPWFFRYRKFVVATAYLSPLREKFPILNRCLSLVLSWVVLNLALVGGVTFMIIQYASLRSGVPIFA